MLDFKNMRKEGLQKLQQLKKKQQQLVLLRTSSFLIMIFSFAAGWDGHIFGLVLGFLMLTAFLLFIRRHQKLGLAMLLTESRLACLQACLDRISGKWRDFPDDGRDLMQKGRPQEADLPLLGPASLYQYLVAARTKAGRRQLASLLSPYPESPDRILQRQQAVKELSSAPEKMIKLEALGHLLPRQADFAEFCTMMEHTAIQPRAALRLLSFILPIISFLSLGLALAGYLGLTIPGLLFSLQLLLTFLLLRRSQALLAPLMALPQEFALYEKIFTAFTHTDWQSPLLQEYQQELRGGQAAESLQQLAALADKAVMRRNIFFFLTANTAVLFDLHCTAKTFHWQAQSGCKLRRWLQIWSELEALLSLANAAVTRATVCWPKFLDGSPCLQGKNITPLLIEETKAVPNDADFKAGTGIITGSNMSGKTTYMRTLATSAILAYAGAPVCAASFSLTPMRVFTSIHVSDDLSKGISTFYAEILRIRQMVEACKEDIPLFLCIDEIFKGTNSADRITGAAAAIKRLTAPHAITLVTTHDFELCDLKSSNHLPIQNYHFEEYYKDDKIHFDFKIKPDRCHTTNAKYLLKMAGILS
ncbi:MutS-related protein [Mitsuokella sp. WILCCON 0060]|uniref:MutS-related protein n=1 Tax=unclassified Mitsuokella TaxID=2637239 RepID=UPI003EFF019B